MIGLDWVNEWVCCNIERLVSNQRISHYDYFEVNFYDDHQNRSKSIFLMSV